jgi:type II secretory pathway component PulJ
LAPKQPHLKVHTSLNRSYEATTLAGVNWKLQAISARSKELAKAVYALSKDWPAHSMRRRLGELRQNEKLGAVLGNPVQDLVKLVAQGNREGRTLQQVGARLGRGLLAVGAGRERVRVGVRPE